MSLLEMDFKLKRFSSEQDKKFMSFLILIRRLLQKLNRIGQN